MHDLLSSDDLRRMSVLTLGFYQRSTEDVARDLLGKILVRRTSEGVAAVRINEVEAYLGVEDPACHTFGGRRTPRTETMWGPAGVAYVYLIYGIHNCLNVVTVGEGTPEAVLIRGGRPVSGLELVQRRRGNRVPRVNLTDGPGKLCQALAVNRTGDGAILFEPDSELSIREDPTGLEVSIRETSRVGVDYAGEAAAWPLRFIDSAALR